MARKLTITDATQVRTMAKMNTVSFANIPAPMRQMSRLNALMAEA